MHVSDEEFEQTLHDLEQEITNPVAGVYGPTTKLWEVNREAIVFLGGGRAALLQTAHPFVAHGVDQHSKTKTQPLGRFIRTFENVFAMVFGDWSSARKAAIRVRTIHKQIHGKIGEFVGPYTPESPYEANDAEALFWVHATLFDTSVQVFELIVRKLSLWEKDVYYEQTKRFARLFGIPESVIPNTWRDFEAYNQAMFDSPVITVGHCAAETARFLQIPPVPSMAPLWKWYWIMTAGLLPPRVRNGYRLPFGTWEQRVFQSSLTTLRASYPRLSANVRTLPAYREALRRLHPEQRPTMLDQMLDQTFRFVKKNQNRLLRKYA
jgi:uncharacterized protein (DUF2236 family)